MKASLRMRLVPELEVARGAGVEEVGVGRGVTTGLRLVPPVVVELHTAVPSILSAV